jgi:hypothetical protein
MFFDENGVLNVDDMIANNASFKTIMEDGVVTEEEIKIQSDKVVALLRNIEAKYDTTQLAEIKDLLVEMGVLYAVYNYYSIMDIKK